MKLIKNKQVIVLLSIAFLYIILLLTGIIKNIVNLDTIVSLDKTVGLWINSFQTAVGIKVFSLITLLGKSYIIIIFAITATIILWLLQKKWQITGLWLSLIGSEAFTYATKLIVDRPRPEYAIYLEHSGSFPSGHATVAIAFYGFLIFLFLHYLRNKQKRYLVTTIGLIIILSIGFSRLYLGVHYFSDVLTGYLIGLLWLYVSISLTKQST